MAHSGILDARNTPPFSSLRVFSYRSLRIRPGKHSVWCQGVTGGVVIPRFASVPPFTAHRDIPSRVPSPQVSPPFFPRQRPDPPREGSGPQYPPFAAPPPRRGHNGKLSVMNFVKMAGTRLVSPHSLAFRPEWYPRAAHPTPRPLSLRRQNAAPRGCPPSGALQHAVSCETAPGGLPHQTHTLREVPRCANSFLLGAYRYKNRRPRPPTMWTDMSQSSCHLKSGLASRVKPPIFPAVSQRRHESSAGRSTANSHRRRQ